MTAHQIIVKNRDLYQIKSALEKVISRQTDMVLAIRWAFRLEKIKAAIGAYQQDLQNLRRSGHYVDDDDLENLKEKEIIFEFIPISIGAENLVGIDRDKTAIISDFMK